MKKKISKKKKKYLTMDIKLGKAIKAKHHIEWVEKIRCENCKHYGMYWIRASSPIKYEQKPKKKTKAELKKMAKLETVRLIRNSATAGEKEKCKAKMCMGRCGDFDVLPCGHRTGHLEASCSYCGVTAE